MWFTRVSLHNPVFATMAMLALVVLGWFSLQRLQIDQFPNIDVPTVVVVTEYPGASPEIVESEVSKKIEEAVNPIGGISNLTSRSYEGQSVVVIEFGLQSEGRKAADDVREKVAGIKPLLRPEVKDSRVLRFDPSAKAIWSMAITAEGVAGVPSPVELTRWADQVVKRRLENVRGVGSATVVGGMPRQINLYLQPAALEAFGVTPEQVATAVENENLDLPHPAPRRFRPDHRGAAHRWAGASASSGPHQRRGAGSRKPGAVQRPAHTAGDGTKSAG